MIKQKIYKSAFSILLTWLCVTAVTYAAGLWYIKDGEVLTEAYMTSLVTAINTKADLQEVYYKTQIDNQYDSIIEEVNAAYDYAQDVETRVTSLNNDIESLTNRVAQLENALNVTPVTPVTPVTQTYDCASQAFAIKSDNLGNATYTVPNGKLGDKKTASGNQSCRPNLWTFWEQSVNYTFTCTSNWWSKTTSLWTCTGYEYTLPIGTPTE